MFCPRDEVEESLLILLIAEAMVCSYLIFVWTLELVVILYCYNLFISHSYFLIYKKSLYSNSNIVR